MPINLELERAADAWAAADLDLWDEVAKVSRAGRRRVRRRRAVAGGTAVAVVVAAVVGVLVPGGGRSDVTGVEVRIGRGFPAGGPVGSDANAGAVSPQTLAESWAGVQVVTRDCMARHGWEYAPVARDVSTFPQAGWLPSGDALRTDGYVGVADARSGEIDVANPKIVGALSAGDRREYTDALFGDPNGPVVTVQSSFGDLSYASTGCFAEGRRAVYGDLAAWASLEAMREYLRRETAGRVRSAAAYADASRRWRECLDDRGIDTTGMYDQAAELAFKIITGPGSDAARRAAELGLAQADADCQSQVGLDTLRTQLWDEQSAVVAAEQGFDVEGARQFEWDAAARAARILAADARR